MVHTIRNTLITFIFISSIPLCALIVDNKSDVPLIMIIRNSQDTDPIKELKSIAAQLNIEPDIDIEQDFDEPVSPLAHPIIIPPSAMHSDANIARATAGLPVTTIVIDPQTMLDTDTPNITQACCFLVMIKGTYEYFIFELPKSELKPFLERRTKSIKNGESQLMRTQIPTTITKVTFDTNVINGTPKLVLDTHNHGPITLSSPSVVNAASERITTWAKAYSMRHPQPSLPVVETPDSQKHHGPTRKSTIIQSETKRRVAHSSSSSTPSRSTTQSPCLPFLDKNSADVASHSSTTSSTTSRVRHEVTPHYSAATSSTYKSPTLTASSSTAQISVPNGRKQSTSTTSGILTSPTPAKKGSAKLPTLNKTMSSVVPTDI